MYKPHPVSGWGRILETGQFLAESQIKFAFAFGFLLTL